jgi:hypothetical protein
VFYFVKREKIEVCHVTDWQLLLELTTGPVVPLEAAQKSQSAALM